MKLSIIIPLYNEEKTIEEIIKRVLKVDLKGVEKEIIVVDDGSVDNSAKIVNSFIKNSLMKNVKLVRHKKNRGKGAAVRTGIKNSRGDLILIQDADLEYDPNDIPRLLQPILAGKAEVVYGSRFRLQRLFNYENRKRRVRKTSSFNSSLL